MVKKIYSRGLGPLYKNNTQRVSKRISGENIGNLDDNFANHSVFNLKMILFFVGDTSLGSNNYPFK